MAPISTSSHCYSWINDSTVWIYTTFSFISFISCRTFELLPFLPIMNIHAYNFAGTYILISLLYILRNRTAGSFDNSAKLFSLSGCTILHPPMTYDSSNFSRSWSTLVIACLFYHSHFSGCEGLSIVALICISLMTNEIEHLLMCMLVICMSSVEKHLCKFFAYF